MIEKERLKQINQIDVAYRDVLDFDNQFEIIKYVLNCLSDKQLNTTQKLIQVYQRKEKENETK